MTFSPARSLLAFLCVASLGLLPAGHASACECIDPPWGMVGWWRGDDSPADAASGNSAIPAGGITYAAGKVDAAFVFDGVDDVLALPVAVHSFMHEDVSIDAWVKVDDLSVSRAIFSTGDFRAAQANTAMVLYVDTDGTVHWTIRLNGSDADTIYTQSSTSLVPGSWYHIVALREFQNETDGVRLYINGAIEDAQPDIPDLFDLDYNGNGPWSTRHASIGVYQLEVTSDIYNTGAGVGAWFDGEIDEVELFDRVLTDDEILALYEADSAGKCKDEEAGDEDDDGVLDDEDVCPGTLFPDAVPTVGLGVSRWSDMDGDGVFDTIWPSSSVSPMPFTIDDTAGCSCGQIITALGLGGGLTKFGCSTGVMKTWVAMQ